MQKTLNHFIISAVEAQERRTKIHSEFTTKLSTFPRFFNAIMGNRLSEQEIKAKVDDKGLLYKGEIGCALSHLSILKAFLASAEQHIFVFEDDVCFSPRLQEALAKIISFVEGNVQPTVVLLYNTEGIDKAVHKISDTCNNCLSRDGTCAHAYVLNRQAARNILSIQTPLHFEFDTWFTYLKLRKIKIYCLSEPLVYLDEENSHKSLIDAQENRENFNAEKRAIKARVYKEVYDSLPLQERLLIQLDRIKRHLRLLP